MRVRFLVGYLLVIAAFVFSAKSAASQGAEIGDWISFQDPPVLLERGESDGDFALLADGSATYAGQALFPPNERPHAMTLRVFPSPDETLSVVFHHHITDGGLRVALIDHRSEDLIPHDVTPEATVGHRKVQPNVSWSPDSRMAAFPISGGQWQGDLLILAINGEHIIHTPDDFGPGNTTYVDMTSLRTDDADWLSVSYDVLTCRPGCLSPEKTGEIGGGHRLMFSADVWAERDIPEVAEVEISASAAPSTGILTPPAPEFVLQVPSQGGSVVQADDLNAARAEIVRGLLEDYDGDEARIRRVAANADYALLALAAYVEDREAPLALALSRGWRPLQTIVIENDIVGDTVAQLFEGPEGRIVLAFRGTEDYWPDQATNILGSALNNEWVRAQLSGAAQIAVDVVARNPDVIFVGHSLGGRLAQVGRLETGRPAVVFNPAPFWESDRSNVELSRATRGLEPVDEQEVPLVAFKGPDDVISSDVFTARIEIEDSFEVSNIVTPGEMEVAQGLSSLRGSTIRWLNVFGFSHSADVLSASMFTVQAVVEEGWLDTYLAQDSTAVVSQEVVFQQAEPQRSDSWGPVIVYDGFRNVFADCGYDEAQRRSCLPGLGMTPRGIDFFLHFSRSVVAKEYIEVGVVDLVHAEAERGARTIVLVNGDPDILEVRTHYDNAREIFLDGASQFLLNRYPSFYGGSITRFVGHRQLPDGGQRFVFSTDLPDGCRACPAIGSAMVYYDFDREGRFVESRPIGIWGPSLFDLAPDARYSVGTSSPPLLQLRLNELGYDAGGMDGVVGERTRSAVRAFQADRCLDETGETDFITMARMAQPDGGSSSCYPGLLTPASD